MPSPSYFVVCPLKIYPNSEYSISVSVNDTKKPTNVDTEITRLAFESEKEISVSTNDTLDKDGSKIIQLKVGNWKGDKCVLRIKGKGGIDFDHLSWLSLQTKSTIKTYIQMDKPKYKPGDVVSIRSVSINEDLQPIPGPQLSILIMDPDGNVMKTFANATSDNSMVFALPDQLLLGNWKLVMVTNDEITSKYFEVAAEQVLPSFDIEITTPSVICFKDSKIPVTVNAVHIHGKPVTGRLELKVSAPKYWGLKETVYETNSQIKGKMDIELDIKSLMKGKAMYDQVMFDIHVTVEDDLSGTSYSRTKSIWVYQNPYQMKFIRKIQKYFPASSLYIPGSDYAFFVKVLYQDDSPVENNGPPLKIQFLAENGEQQEVSSVPADGVAWFSLNTRLFGTKDISLTGVYKEYEFDLDYVSPADTKNGFIQVQDQTAEPERHYAVGETATIRIDSSHAMKDLFYEIVHREGVVSNHVKVHFLKQHLVLVPITSAMAPESKLIFHTVCKSNIQVDQLTLLVSDDFRKNVSKILSSSPGYPEKTLAIEIQSEPHSSVGTAAMDQRLVLSKIGNDFDKSVLIEVEKAVNFVPENTVVCTVYNPLSPVFQEAGLLLFTNLIKDKYPKGPCGTGRVKAQQARANGGLWYMGVQKS